MKKNKGQKHWDVLLEISIAVVVILVMAVITYKEKNVLEDTGKRTTCEINIYESHQAKYVTGGKTLNLQGISACERGVLTLTKNDIVKSGEIDQERASQLLADSMAQCWKQYGRGTLDPFSDWENEEVSL